MTRAQAAATAPQTHGEGQNKSRRTPSQAGKPARRGRIAAFHVAGGCRHGWLATRSSNSSSGLSSDGSVRPEFTEAFSSPNLFIQRTQPVAKFVSTVAITARRRVERDVQG